MSAGVLALLALLSLAGAGVARAAGSEVTFTGFITTLPAVINSQGTWCMTQDLSTSISSGFAITINTNNVTIDCNGFKLGGLAAGIGTAAYGIYAQDRLNATVRNCTIRGFQFGLRFYGGNGGGHLVEDNRFDGNTYCGMQVVGDGSLIQRNLVFATGGSTAISAEAPLGIVADGSSDVLDNTVSGVTALVGGNGGATGIYASGDLDGLVEGNRVHGLVADGGGLATGIYATSGHLSVRRNDLVSTNSGGGTVGMQCGAAVLARDNTALGFATGFSNCTATNNYSAP
jgi:hypothetical protein